MFIWSTSYRASSDNVPENPPTTLSVTVNSPTILIVPDVHVEAIITLPFPVIENTSLPFCPRFVTSIPPCQLRNAQWVLPIAAPKSIIGGTLPSAAL